MIQRQAQHQHTHKFRCHTDRRGFVGGHKYSVLADGVELDGAVPGVLDHLAALGHGAKTT